MSSSGFPYKKVVVIGATSGLGEALATKLIEEGISVVVTGRRKEKLDEFVKKHGENKASASVFDITKLDKIAAWADELFKSHPDIDSIMLNSGIQRGFDFSKPETVDLSVAEEEFNTNYVSYLYLTKAFTPYLQKQSGPTSLIYTTSGLALVPMLRCPNYCAGKAALHHFTLTLREQLKNGPGNIKVIEILPPAVQTELHDAKHQPDIKNGGQIGIPLEQFVEEAWAGLSKGDEQIPVGSSKAGYKPDGFETKRQEAFQGMTKQIAEMMSKHS